MIAPAHDTFRAVHCCEAVTLAVDSLRVASRQMEQAQRLDEAVMSASAVASAMQTVCRLRSVACAELTEMGIGWSSPLVQMVRLETSRALDEAGEAYERCERRW